jgi:hypothetical protein
MGRHPSAAAGARGPGEQLAVRLNTPADLFRTAVVDDFLETGRLVSGMDELVQELTPRRLRPQRRVVVVLPAPQVRPETHDLLRQAVQRYCRLRIRQADLALRSQRREVVTATGVGGVLFVLGLALSFHFSQAAEPTALQVLLGNGVFLVIAWVGLWYPLDTLVFARRPLLRERRVLSAILAMELTVQGEDIDAPQRYSRH